MNMLFYIGDEQNFLTPKFFWPVFLSFLKFG